MSSFNRHRYGGRDQPDEDGWFEHDKGVVLRIDGVTGACDLAGFEGWISVMSYKHNLLRHVSKRERPLHIRQAAALRKKRAFIAAGLNQHGGPLSSAEAKKVEDGTVIPPTPAELEARPSEEDCWHNYQAALENYDSDADLDFRDDELPPRPNRRPHIGEFTIDKHSDIASPQLMSMILSGEEFTAQIAFVQARAKKADPTPKDDSASSSSAADDADEAKKDAVEISREYVITQNHSLTGCVLSSLNLSGGCGGIPCETLSIRFGRFSRTVDCHAKREKDAAVQERTITYDRLRKTVELS